MKATRFVLILLLIALTCAAAEQPVTVSWAAKDTAGNAVAVPTQSKVSVVAFLRADQKQSTEALAAVARAVGSSADVQVIVVLSGQLTEQQIKSVAASTQPAFPIVADPDFSASGQMSVHVWPTTVIVRSDGGQAGHLAGLPTSFASDLHAYIDFAQDKIDQTTLHTRLENQSVVQDSSSQAAKRRLQVATRLLESGEVEKAGAEVEAALKLAPHDPSLLLAKANVLIAAGDAATALDVVNAVPAGAAPAWQIELLKGRALVALERWDDAKRALPESIKLNPNPAEAHYLLGIAHQNTKEFEKAAEEFRAACEAASGQKLTMPRGKIK